MNGKLHDRELGLHDVSRVIVFSIKKLYKLVNFFAFECEYFLGLQDLGNLGGHTWVYFYMNQLKPLLVLIIIIIIEIQYEYNDLIVIIDYNIHCCDIVKLKY